jgi:ABC-type sugar transport system ATPase subunit
VLSGGNQQKVLLAKWLEMSPKVLIVDEPTRGVDIGAKEEIYHLLQSLAAEGMAIAVASRERSVLATLDIRRYTLFGGSLWGGDHSTAVWTSLKTGERIRPGKLS